jgi:uncharacterized peroxidase-related enzyme
MAHIRLKDNLPGIIGLIFNNSRTGKAVCHLTQAALRGPSGLAVADRELIAAHVSSLNDCDFCVNIHGAVVSEVRNDNGITVSCTLNDPETANISGKMKALLRIAAKVQQSGKAVMEEDISHARKNGATDDDIHDTVFIAAAFCFFNRYVDGLGTTPMAREKDYIEPARALLKFGYRYPNFIGRYFMKRAFLRSQKS